jgi:SAM-dependent methyltransferase
MVLRENQSYYDEFAAGYEAERHHGYHALVDDLESELACRYGAGGDVLEAGCGTGLILRRVHAVARSAYGADLSRGMLAGTTRRGLPCVQATLTTLPFARERFDLVYSFKVLAHVEPIADALAELARVTRPGGRLLLEFYNQRSLRYWIRRLRPPLAISARTREDAVFTRFDTIETIRQVLPEEVAIEGVRGVRVLTPVPHAFRLPGVGPLLSRAERWAADAPRLRDFGGFLIVIARKRG